MGMMGNFGSGSDSYWFMVVLVGNHDAGTMGVSREEMSFTLKNN